MPIRIPPPHLARFATGARVCVRSSYRGPFYQPGQHYTVNRVDWGDNTLAARDARGEEGPWVPIGDLCLTDEIGWDWLRRQLPPEAIDLLSAFEGLEALRLRDELRDHIVLKSPNLKESILQAVGEVEPVTPAETPRPRRVPPPPPRTKAE